MEAEPAVGGKHGKLLQHARPLELIEEAVHLLRRSPPGVFAAYYLGTVPFVLGLLFFWADMSRSFSASSRLIPGALGLSAAYIFMKTMQTVFAVRLKNGITGQRTAGTGLKFTARTALMHAIYQPWGFLILPAALLLTVPFGWCFAFYQNLTVLGPGEGDLPAARKRAWEQALLWPAQNHMALAIWLLFSLVVMANLFVTAIYAPHLIRIFFGIETVFSRSGIHMANTTYLMIIAAGTYLCVDPMVKAYYTLRCYYGQALENGEDLRAGLRSARRRRTAGLMAVFTVTSLIAGGASPAAARPVPGLTAAPTAGESGYSPEEIEKAAEDVLSRIEYSWRLPRDAEEESPEPDGFLHGLVTMLGGWLGKIAENVEAFFEWLGKILRKLFFMGDGRTEEERSAGIGGSPILYILIFAGAAACALILQRLFRRKKEEEPVQTGSAPVTAADLEDEGVLASDLPENEWLSMAHELLGRGEVRLGIRALYLASLARLAGRGIIILARHKTDREYESELSSRGEVLAEITSAFRDMTGIFERAWYGGHAIPRQTLDFYLRRHQEVMADGR